MSVLRDIKLAFRLFWRSPSLTGIALVSIALSVGDTVVVFAAVKLVMINPLPYARAGELVQIRTEFPRFGASHSDRALWNDAQEIIRRTRTLASAGVYRNEILNLSAAGSTPPEALYGLRASASLVPTLGVTPMPSILLRLMWSFGLRCGVAGLSTRPREWVPWQGCSF